jgi:spore maturation protein CgeB
MRILVATPGHIRTAPMGAYSAETLKSLGHEVRLVDAGSLTLAEKIIFRPIAKLRGRNRIEKTYLNARLLKEYQDFRPELFISIFGFDIFPETIDRMRKKGTRTACWWLNDPFQFDRGLFLATSYDYFFSNCAASTLKYQNHGVNAFHLPHAAFLPKHRPYKVSQSERKTLQSEVCFVGDWGPVRQGILSILSQKIDLKIWGPWKKHLSKKDRLWSRINDGYFSTETMGKVFSCTKIAINLHSWFGYYNTGYNPRTFETPACGAFQICDWKEDLDKHFSDGSEIIYYRSGSEMEYQIKHFLTDESARKQIAQAGYQRALREHT